MEPSISDADPTAVFGRRIRAALIDAVAVLFLWWLVAAGAGGGAGGYFVATLIAFVVSFINMVVVQGETGASLGKFVSKLRTVDRLGRKPRARRAIIRWRNFPVDLAAFSAMKEHPQNRRGGDMKAGTFVIDVSGFGSIVPLTSSERAASGMSEEDEAAAGAADSIDEEAAALAYADDVVTEATPSAETTFPLQLRGAGTAKGADPVNGIAPTIQNDLAAGSAAQWDPARAAYVHKDASTGALHQFDPTTGQWFPLTD